MKRLKRKCNVLGNVLKIMGKLDRRYYFLLFMKTVIDTTSNIYNVFILSLIINTISKENNFNSILKMLVVIILIKILLLILSEKLENYYDISKEKMTQLFTLELSKKNMDLDYDKIENAEILDLKDKASYPVVYYSAIPMLLNAVVLILTSAFSIIGLFIVLAKFNWIYSLAIILLSLISVFFDKEFNKRMVEITKELIPINRRLSYYTNMATLPDYQKEYRVYGLNKLMDKKLSEYSEHICQWLSKAHKSKGKNQIRQSTIMLIIKVLEYLTSIKYLLIVEKYSRITIGEFTIIINATDNITERVSNLFNGLIDIFKTIEYLDPLYDFMQIKNSKKSGGEIPSVFDSLEFVNVRFKYPNSQQCTIKDMNFKITSGERIAFIGENGAGKSTVIKLISRLYEEYEGTILWNGKDIRLYDKDKLQYQMAIVFQDYTILPLSIKENILANVERQVSEDEIQELIRTLDLEKKIDEFPDKLDSLIDKALFEKGIDLSIGQKQKLAIARASIRNSTFLLFDEPTAALDPIAEADIFEKFIDMSNSKTSIWVSHRMSICKMVDCIFVINQGEIIASGSHSELMNQCKLYNRLYSEQAKHYNLVKE